MAATAGSEEEGWGDDVKPEANADDFFFDGDNTSAEDLGGTPSINKEGWYHLEITDVVPDPSTVNAQGKEKSPSVRFDMVVQESVPGQCPAQTKHFHRIYTGSKGGGAASEGARNNAFRFGLGLKLLEEKQFENRDKPSIVVAGTDNTRIGMSIWNRAKGMHCMAQIKFQKGKDGFEDKYEIDFGRVYLCDDPYVEDMPKNVEILKAIGVTASPGKRAEAPGKKTSKSPPAGTSKEAGNARAETKKPDETKAAPPKGPDLDDL